MVVLLRWMRPLSVKNRAKRKKQGPREDQLRWAGFLEIDGETTDMKLFLDYYPAWPHGLKFTIQLTLGSTIFRMECAEFASHVNRPPCPHNVEVGLIQGPHYHSWLDNRHLCTRIKLPKKLSFARYLPANIQGLENSLRWFCGETNIVIDYEIPTLPKQQRLPI